MRRWLAYSPVRVQTVRVVDLHDKGLVINYGEGGLQNGKIAGPKLFAHPPSRQGKTFCVPPYNMATTSSYRVKTTPKLVVSPFS